MSDPTPVERAEDIEPRWMTAAYGRYVKSIGDPVTGTRKSWEHSMQIAPFCGACAAVTENLYIGRPRRSEIPAT